MATTVNEVVHVKELSRYGFRTPDGKPVNWSTKLSEEEKGKVVPGASYEMTLYISDKGARYANTVGKQVGEVVAPPKVDKAVVESPRKQLDVKPRDFDKEARGKTRCALLEAVLSNSAVNFDEIEKHLPMIDKLVAYVFGDR